MCLRMTLCALLGEEVFISEIDRARAMLSNDMAAHDGAVEHTEMWHSYLTVSYLTYRTRAAGIVSFL